MGLKKRTMEFSDSMYAALTIPVKVRVASQIAATDFEIVVFHAPPFVSDASNGNDALEYGRTTLYTVKNVRFIPDTTQAGATATKSTYTINRYDSAGANGAVVATFDGITGADLTALTAKDFGAITSATLKSGETLTLKKVHTSTGTATPAGLLILDVV